MKIGVFDSGIGGMSFVRAIKAEMPAAEIIFRTDHHNFPYSTKTPAEIWRGIVPIFQEFIDLKVDAIVIACNTVSTTLSERLRQTFSAVPIVALDPMIKPAAQISRSKVIAVCATPTTLASDRYNELKQHHGSGLRIIEPDCADWSSLIEANLMNESKIRNTIGPALDANADVIVLACTHYHWIEEKITKLVKARAVVLQPEAATIAQLKRVLGQQP